MKGRKQWERQKFASNAGMSLVELLVAIGIAGIVMVACTVLISQGVKQYNINTITTQLEEDASIAVNNICNSVMEGTKLEISTSSSDPWLWTRDAEVYWLDMSEHILYYGTSMSEDDSGQLCKNVKNFKVQFLKSSLITAPESEGSANVIIKGIRNPFQVRITLELEFQGITRTVSRVVSMRNDLAIGKVKLQGYDPNNIPYGAQISEYLCDD